jgi:hypothetical protein
MMLNTYGVLEHLLATLRASRSRHAMGISGVGSHFWGVYLNDDNGIPEDDSIEHLSAL